MKKYIIITPARDEADNIETTIKCILNQTIKPLRWIIVNDGSSDDTGLTIDRYSKQFDWIETIHIKNRGFRQAGTGVIEAFYAGYNSLEEKEYDYIIKMDGDLSFNKDYFEKCFEYFTQNPKLGIGGGEIYHNINGEMKLEKNPLFHVRGATKIYKKECWDDIGGLIKAPGWDTIDEVKANMLGWETRSFTDIKVIHLRYTGDADGAWRNFVKGGIANYISGYHPLFMFARCFVNLFQKPYIIRSLGLFYGFITSYFRKISPIDDKKLIKYIRKQQLNRLLHKESIWK